MALPDRAVISFSDITSNSALISWRPRDPLEDERSPITSYTLSIKQTFTRDTIVDNRGFPPTQTSYFFKNLDPDTEYSIFVFIRNRFGRGESQRTDFRTLKVDTLPVITLSSEAQIILNKFDNGDYIILEGVNNGIELVKNGSITSELFVITFNRLLQNGQIIDKTITVTPPVVTPPELTFCINVYDIRSSGSVYSTHYDKINLSNLENLLNQNKYIFYCKDGIIPTEKQVQDFYNFTPLPPAVDTSINETMVSQSIGSFILKDGKIRGEILYIANQSFNPFYYGKNLTSLVQIKSKTGIPIAVKPNNLNFTNTQRDERIQINEAVGNFKELIVDFYVWKSTSDSRAFTGNKQIQVVEELPPPPDEPDKFKPCAIGFHKDFSGKCVPDDPIGELPRDKLIDTLKGFLFGTVALSLLARKY